MTEYLSNKIRTISFFAILLVYLQHSINFTGYINPGSLFIGKGNFNSIIQYVVGYGFARPAVAVFFLLSGFLFFRNFVLAKTFEKYKSRFRSLFIPYILWNTVALLFIIGLQLIPTIQTNIASFYTGYLSGRSLQEYVQIVTNHGVAFQLWFLYDLMLYALFAPVIYLAVRYLSIFLIIPLCFLWLFRIPLPPFFSFLDRGGLFYLIGAYLAMHPISVSAVASKKMFSFAGCVWLILLVIKTLISFTTNGFTSYLPTIDNMAIVLGLFTIWFAYDAVANTRIIFWLGSQAVFTFFIYAAHEPLLEVMKYAGVTITGNSNTSLLVFYFAVPVVTYLFCVCVAKLGKKYTPFLYAILTGGR
jgi:surface polysaccharide O-acyltransferase-like enzyme